MSIFQHLKQQPFVVATGLAALIHSTWSLGTLFAGPQPAVEEIASLIEVIHFLGWLVPAFLIAFALDVGQIATSHEIRLHGLTPMRGLTFGVFALATFYLQFVYIGNHMPNLTLSSGIADTHRAAAQFMSDLAIWLFPALLPLSTLLYTFSGREDQQVNAVAPIVQMDVKPVEKIANKLAETSQEFARLLPGVDETGEFITMSCDACGWSTTKDSYDSARRALAAHQSLHCVAIKDVVSANGNGVHHE